jgi:hypothetical protein
VAAIVTVALLTRGGEASGLVAALVLTGYSLLDPIAFSRQPGRWWSLALRSVGGWLVVLIPCLPIATGLREGSLIFLFPVMVYPPALVLGGLNRALLNRRNRGARERADGASTG